MRTLTRAPWPHAVPPVAVGFEPGATLVRVHGALVGLDTRRGETPAGAAPTAPGPPSGPPPEEPVEALARGIAAAHRPVVVNVARVPAIDTDGLRWLMRLTRPARSGGETLILESPTAAVDEVLALAGCHSWFSAVTRPGARGRSDTARLIQTLPA